MTGPLILSLFPGIGMLDLAFEQAWPEACVVRGPDVIFNSLSDIKTFHPPEGKFDGVIGGPPCQAFSSLRFLVAHNGYKIAENLIPEYERCVQEAQPSWWLMENVPKAPDPVIPGYQAHSFLFNNRWLGEEQRRVRRFWFGTRDGRKIFPEQAVFENQSFQTAVLACELTGGMSKASSKHRIGCRAHKGRSFQEMVRLQGLPEDFTLPPFTREGKSKAVGNGVPLPMGRAIAKAVKQALSVTMIGVVLVIGQPAQAESRRGYASWYSYASARREGTSGIMANGRRMNDQVFTAALRSYDFGRRYRVTNLKTGKFVVVTHTDYGPSKRLKDRAIDLSKSAFAQIDELPHGLCRVSIEPVRGG